MRISKKILAFTLSILMAFSMMPFTAFAADEPTVTWDAATENIQIGEDCEQSNPYDASYTKDAITVSATSEEGHTYIDGTRFSEAFMGDLSGFVFTNSVANFSKIKLVFTDLSIVSYNRFFDSEYNDDPHWSSDLDSKTVTWEGDSNSVGLYAYGVEGTLDRIEFTYEEPTPSAYAGYVPAETDDADALAAKVIKFNGHDWYLIEDNSTSETEGTVTLFAADTSFGTSSFDATDLDNKYSTSMVKTYLDGMTETGGAFADVADAIETVTVTTDNDTDVTAKLYLLSKSEAGALPVNVLMLGNFTNADYYGETYWLRSPNPNDGMEAAYVDCTDGTIHNGSQVYRTFGVRPALKLDLSKVEFNSETKTFAVPTPAVPQATVTEVTAPEGAAFAYKFEADAAKPTAYDSYHADFVATFDRDIKAGEVTLYGKYGDYGWVELTINEDVPAGTPYRIYKNLMNDTLTYATVRDEVSPFYCGAGGAVLADTNMTVNFVLYPVEGGTEGAPVEASEAVTDEIEKPEVKDKYSITINDKVELNVLIEETDVTKLGVKYNKTPDEENDGTPDEAEIISVSSLTKQDNYYVVNVPLAPAQIRDVITIDVYKGDNLDRTISTSVAKYCEAIVNDHAYTGDNAELVEALAQATLDYGKAASDYFGYNTDAYAGYTISNNTLPSLSGLVANDTTGLVTGVRYVAKSVPELRLETSLTEANFFDDEGNALYSVSCAEGYAAKFAKVGNTVVIEVKGIPASKLGEAIHLNVSGKVNGAIEYTPLAFSSVASRSSDNNLKALGIAIANYGVAAANLF